MIFIGGKGRKREEDEREAGQTKLGSSWRLSSEGKRRPAHPPTIAIGALSDNFVPNKAMV